MKKMDKLLKHDLSEPDPITDTQQCTRCGRKVSSYNLTRGTETYTVVYTNKYDTLFIGIPNLEVEDCKSKT